MSSELAGGKATTHEKQVRRLCSLRFSDKLGEDGIRELRDQLRGIAPKLDFATKVIDRAIQEDQIPTPVDLARIASVLRKEAEAPSPQGCELCEGLPWITVQQKVRDPSGKIYMADGSERCQCPKGQWFRQKDRENEAKRKAGLPV